VAGIQEFLQKYQESLKASQWQQDGYYKHPYPVSKLASNLFAKALHNKIGVKGFFTFAACPDLVKTNLSKMRTRSLEEGAETPLWLCTEAGEDYCGRLVKDRKICGYGID